MKRVPPGNVQPVIRGLVAAALLAGLVMASCRDASVPGSPSNPGTPAINAEAERVADSFVREALSGDWSAASRFVYPTDVPFVRDLTEDFVEDNLQAVGPPRISGNKMTYALRGRRSPDFGGGFGRVKATLEVWLSSMSSEWLIEGWSFQVRSVDFPPYET